MNTTYAILYRSLVSRPLGELELRALGVRASQRNARSGISSLLVHGQHEHTAALGAFVQWLEGPEREVRDLFASISEDVRHHGIEVIAEGPADELTERPAPLLSGWDLDVCSISALPATLPGFLRFVRNRRFVRRREVVPLARAA